MGFEDNVEDTGASFNMGLRYLFRIDTLLKLADTYSIGRQLEEWKFVLDAVYREIDPYVKPDEIKVLDGILVEVNTAYANHSRADRMKSSINQVRKSIVASQFYQCLDKYEKYLRRLLKEKDFLMPAKDDPRYALGGRPRH